MMRAWKHGEQRMRGFPCQMCDGWQVCMTYKPHPPKMLVLTTTTTSMTNNLESIIILFACIARMLISTTNFCNWNFLYLNKIMPQLSL